MIEYAVHPPALLQHLATHLRGKGYEASTDGRRLRATHPTAADPTEERLVLGAVIAAWCHEHPDARVDPTDFDPFT